MFKRISLLFVLLLVCMISTAASAATFKLPDTGQTKCYQNVEPWAEVPCTGTRQDGAYNINPPSYTDNSDGTVTDNNTGFMWQKEHGSTYNWFEASGTYDATYNPDSQDVCGSLHLGSRSDWWLPTEKELLSIVDYTVPYPGPTIDTTYFPNTEANGFWSSTKYANASYIPWLVNFSYGDSGEGYMDNLFYVRCVRGGHYPDNNYGDNGDGTVTDNATGLIWQQGEGGHRTWGSALSYCEGLSLGGHSDWRLPNINEIESLADYTQSPAIDTTYFPNAYDSCYWSSTTVANYQNYAWIACFYIGGVDGEYKGFDSYVRCVRGGCNTPVNPGLTSPPNGVAGVSTTPTLDWDDVSGATSYEVQVCTDSGCLSIIRTAVPSVSDWTVTPSLKPVKTYYWRVKAVSADCGSSSWSNISSFTTACPTLDVPSLISPSNGPGASVTPTLDWNDVTGAASYRVQVCSDVSCSYVVATALTTNSQWTVSPALSPTTTYYWRVKAKNSCSSSAWSEIWSFKTKPTITVVTPNGSPTPENWQAGTTQTISWTYTGTPGPYVKIELFKAGILKSTIKASKSIGSNGSGYYNWIIPVNQKAGCDYKIKITSTTNINVRDKSNGTFCILSQ